VGKNYSHLFSTYSISNAIKKAITIAVVSPLSTCGCVEELLRCHRPAPRNVEEQNVDLTVIGAYGRGILFHLLIGGNTSRIMGFTPSDILLVRALQAKSSTRPAAKQ